MDLQGIHTLPELAEVKSVVARITKPDGWVILNADDATSPASPARSAARVAYFTPRGRRSARVRRHLRGGGRAYLVRDGVIGEAEGERGAPLAPLADVPVVLGGAARHNVANALAAAGGARAMGASLAQRARGPPIASSRRSTTRAGASTSSATSTASSSSTSPTTRRVSRCCSTSSMRSRRRSATGGRRAPVSGIVGLAGDRPDDTLRGVGRQVAQRVDGFVQKEMLHYLRGRTRESVLGEIRAGAREGGWKGDIPVYLDEPDGARPPSSTARRPPTRPR